MKLSYHAEMESLYIHLAVGVSAECVEIYDGVVLDYDSTGSLVGIDIDKMSSLPQELEIPERIPIPAGASGASASNNAWQTDA